MLIFNYLAIPLTIWTSLKMSFLLSEGLKIGVYVREGWGSCNGVQLRTR